MTDHQPLTTQQLDEIAARATERRAALTQWINRNSPQPGQQALENAEAVLEEDVPALLADNQHLRQQLRQQLAELAVEQAQHACTLRQRNNRSQRLLHLRDLASMGNVEALIAAAKDTLAASVNDHTPADTDDEGLSGPCDCGEGAVHYTTADCPAAQRTAGAQQ